MGWCFGSGGNRNRACVSAANRRAVYPSWNACRKNTGLDNERDGFKRRQRRSLQQNLGAANSRLYGTQRIAGEKRRLGGGKHAQHSRHVLKRGGRGGGIWLFGGGRHRRGKAGRGAGLERTGRYRGGKKCVCL